MIADLPNPTGLCRAHARACGAAWTAHQHLRCNAAMRNRCQKIKCFYKCGRDAFMLQRGRSCLPADWPQQPICEIGGNLHLQGARGWRGTGRDIGRRRLNLAGNPPLDHGVGQEQQQNLTCFGVGCAAGCAAVAPVTRPASSASASGRAEKDPDACGGQPRSKAAARF